LEVEAVHPLLPLLRKGRKQLVLGLRLGVSLDRFCVHAANQFGQVLSIAAANAKDDFGLYVGQHPQHPGGKLR
jgi:hypothetical protein